MSYYTGIDVSLRSVSICIVDETGEVRHEAKVAAETAVIVACLRRFSDEIKQVGPATGLRTGARSSAERWRQHWRGPSARTR